MKLFTISPVGDWSRRNCFISFSVTSSGLVATIHVTVSRQGGVVRLPSYEKYGHSTSPITSYSGNVSMNSIVYWLFGSTTLRRNRVQPDHRNAVDLFAGRRERFVQPVVEHQVDLHRVPLVVVHVLRPNRTVDAPVKVELIEQVLGFQWAPAQHRPISAGAPVVGLPVEPERSLAVHQQGAARVEQDGALVAATAPRIHPVPEKLPAAGAGRGRCRSSAGAGSFASARSASGSAGK
uniref:Uncharacterized protein n=1 Tax=Anopheles merus TaxID=30066 RepID=A0A182VGB1_ANOME